MKCQKCEQTGQVMLRVNERGIAGVWECSPCCDIPFITDEAALIYTLTLEHDKEKTE